MATNVANSATRQQLDELDSLLKKMLSLPVNHLDEANSQPSSPLAQKMRQVHAEATVGTMPPPTPPKFPPPAVVYGVPPAPAFAADSPGAANPSPPSAPPAEPVRGWAIDLNPRGSSSVLGNRSPLAEADPRPAVRPTPLLQVQAMTESPLPPVRGRAQPHRVALPLRPLAAVTARFDNAVAGFGPLGRVFSTRFGRFVMGWTGLAMLAWSAAQVAFAWSGWTH